MTTEEYESAKSDIECYLMAFHDGYSYMAENVLAVDTSATGEWLVNYKDRDAFNRLVAGIPRGVETGGKHYRLNMLDVGHADLVLLLDKVPVTIA